MADDAIKRLIELGINATPALRELDKLGKETAKQTQSIQGIEKQMQSFASSFVTGLSIGAITAFASQAIGAFKGMIDTLDALDEKSQNLGISVERLQTLGATFELSGVKSEKLEMALGKLAGTMADLDSPTNNAARLLREVGVAAGDDAYEAMLKIADVFANAPDGIDKTAYAIEVFGAKIGPQLVAALNGGRAGIQSTEAEMEKLGITSAETAKLAGEFNDNMDKLERMASQVGLAIARDLLPQLVAVSERLLRNVKDGTVWLDFWQRYKKWTKDFWSGGDSAAELTALDAQRAWEDAGAAAIAAQTAIVQAGKAGEVPKAAAPAKTPKPKSGGSKTTKEQLSEWDKWLESLKKLDEQTDNTDAKVQHLEGMLNDLAAAGITNTQWTEALRKELEKLRPDPVAKALEKISDAAKEIDENTPRMIVALQMQLEALEVAGLGATTQARLLREELLKMQGVSDPIAQVNYELGEMEKTMKRNADMSRAWVVALFEGTASAEQYTKGSAKYFDDTGLAIDKTKDKTKSLSDSIGEMSAKFVGDFSDKLIDSFGQVGASFENMIADMIKQLAKLLLNSQFQALFKSVEGAGGWGALFSAAGAAKGAAWNASGVEYMARGGILNQPMFFANGGRLAVAGEAGPEGVVPLRRGASGDLGVAASPVNIEVNNYTDTSVQTSSRDNVDMSKTITVEIRRQVKQALTDGSMDRTMRSAYGLSRQPVIG
jgi:hypothetical protein